MKAVCLTAATTWAKKVPPMKRLQMSPWKEPMTQSTNSLNLPMVSDERARTNTASSNLSIERVTEGLETGTFSFGLPTYAIGTDASVSGPEVSTYEIEALLKAGSLTDPIFIDSEPTRAGRKRKAKDMSGLSVCFCGERAKPDDVDSIQCQKAGCATLWVCCPLILLHSKSMADFP